MENTKPWFIAMILLVFTAGIFAGILLDKKFFAPAPTAASVAANPGTQPGDEPPLHGFRGPGGPGDRGKPGEPGKDRHRQHFVDMLTRVLDLSEDQQKQVDAIMEKNEPDMLAMRDDMQKRMDTFHARVTAEISRTLDEKQLEKFKEMNEQFEKGGMDRRPPMGFPGKGPGMGGRPGPPPENMQGMDPQPQD